MTTNSHSAETPACVPAPGHGAPRIEARWEKPVTAASGGAATLLVRITAPAPQASASVRAAPLDVAFVLDRSGSMSGGKLHLAREGVDLAVARLRDDDRAALVVYDDAVDTLAPLSPATPRAKAALRLALHGVDPGGSTFLSGGWVAGCQALAAAPDAGSDTGATRIRRVILLTDGLANVGIQDPAELARHAGELRRRGIATTAVGVGADFDEGLLSAMAEAGGGNFQYVADPAGLRAFFATELQELFSVAAIGLSISLTMPPGVTADLVSAFPVEAAGSCRDVAIGDLPAADEIDLVFTVTTAPGASGEALPCALHATWTDPRADVRLTVQVALEPLRRAAADVVERTPRDEWVAEQAALQRAAAERRAGLDLDRAGRYAESRVRMAAAYDALAAAPSTQEVRYSLLETEALAQAPATVAYESHFRKQAQFQESQRRRGRVARGGEDSHGS